MGLVSSFKNAVSRIRGGGGNNKKKKPAVNTSAVKPASSKKRVNMGATAVKKAIPAVSSKKAAAKSPAVKKPSPAIASKAKPAMKPVVKATPVKTAGKVNMGASAVKKAMPAVSTAKPKVTAKPAISSPGLKFAPGVKPGGGVIKPSKETRRDFNQKLNVNRGETRPTAPKKMKGGTPLADFLKEYHASGSGKRDYKTVTAVGRQTKGGDYGDYMLGGSTVETMPKGLKAGDRVVTGRGTYTVTGNKKTSGKQMQSLAKKYDDAQVQLARANASGDKNAIQTAEANVRKAANNILNARYNVDTQNVNYTQQAQAYQTIQQAQKQWAKANQSGNKKGMKKAHEKAEEARKQLGFSGGDWGNDYIPNMTDQKAVKAESKPGFLDRVRGAADYANAQSNIREAKKMEKDQRIYSNAVETYQNAGEKGAKLGSKDKGSMSRNVKPDPSYGGANPTISMQSTEKRDYMSDRDRYVYNFLYQTQGKKAAENFLDAAWNTKNAQKAADVKNKETEKFGKQHPVAATAFSFVQQPFTTMAGAGQMIDNAVTGRKADPYKLAQAGMTESLRGGASSTIKSDVGKGAYSLGTSLGDMVIDTLVGGTFVGGAKGAAGFAARLEAKNGIIANALKRVTANPTAAATIDKMFTAQPVVLGLLGTQSGFSTYRNSIQSGASTEIALRNGIANGVLEIVSETPAVEGFFKMGKLGKMGGTSIFDVKSMAKQIGGQMLTEAGGESFANLTQNLSDSIIMGSNSQVGQKTEMYMGQGMTREEALKKARTEAYVVDTAVAGLQGAIMGAGMGGGATAFNQYNTGKYINGNSSIAKDIARTYQDVIPNGKYSQTAIEILESNPNEKGGISGVSIISTANMKGEIANYYSNVVNEEEAKSQIYSYVGLDRGNPATNRLKDALAFSTGRPTGYESYEFTKAWLAKSREALNLANMVATNPSAVSPEILAELQRYNEYASALLYSNELSEEGSTSSFVRATVNSVLHGYNSSAGGENVVSEDLNETILEGSVDEEGNPIEATADATENPAEANETGNVAQAQEAEQAEDNEPNVSAFDRGNHYVIVDKSGKILKAVSKDGSQEVSVTEDGIDIIDSRTGETVSSYPYRAEAEEQTEQAEQSPLKSDYSEAQAQKINDILSSGRENISVSKLVGKNDLSRSEAQDAFDKLVADGVVEPKANGTSGTISQEVLDQFAVEEENEVGVVTTQSMASELLEDAKAVIPASIPLVNETKVETKAEVKAESKPAVSEAKAEAVKAEPAQTSQKAEPVVSTVSEQERKAVIDDANSNSRSAGYTSPGRIGRKLKVGSERANEIYSEMLRTGELTANPASKHKSAAVTDSKAGRELQKAQKNAPKAETSKATATAQTKKTEAETPVPTANTQQTVQAVPETKAKVEQTIKAESSEASTAKTKDAKATPKSEKKKSSNRVVATSKYTYGHLEGTKITYEAGADNPTGRLEKALKIIEEKKGRAASGYDLVSEEGNTVELIWLNGSDGKSLTRRIRKTVVNINDGTIKSGVVSGSIDLESVKGKVNDNGSKRLQTESTASGETESEFVSGTSGETESEAIRGESGSESVQPVSESTSDTAGESTGDAGESDSESNQSDQSVSVKESSSPLDKSVREAVEEKHVDTVNKWIEEGIRKSNGIVSEANLKKLLSNEKESGSILTKLQKEGVIEYFDYDSGDSLYEVILPEDFEIKDEIDDLRNEARTVIEESGINLEGLEMKSGTRYFVNKETGEVISVEKASMKDLLDAADKAIKSDEFVNKYSILYKDGAEVIVDEDFRNKSVKRKGVKSIVETSGDGVRVFGNFEIEEDGEVYPAEDETIADGISEVNSAVNEETVVEEEPATEEAEGIEGAVVSDEVTEIFSPSDNDPIEVRYAVVPIESMIPSNDPSGNVNPDYPSELQPRDRTRTATKNQIVNILGNLNPKKLLDNRMNAADGSPIVNKDGIVVSGNMRTMVLTRMYEVDEEKAESYRDTIIERAEELGIDTSNLPENPVLVGITENSDMEYLTELSRRLNSQSTAAYSTTEQAFTDAKQMSDALVNELMPFDSEITRANNEKFILNFVRDVIPNNDQGSVLDSKGNLSKKGRERIEYAIFAYAYEDSDILERLSELTDNNVKNITNSLMNASGKAARFRTLAKNGNIPNNPVIDTILEGVNIFIQSRENGYRNVADYLSQSQFSIDENGNFVSSEHSSEAEWFADFIDNNVRSAKRLTVMMNYIYEEATQESRLAGQQNMFEMLGDEFGIAPENRTTEDILEGASNRYFDEADNNGKEKAKGRRYERSENEIEEPETSEGSTEEVEGEKREDVGNSGESTEANDDGRTESEEVEDNPFIEEESEEYNPAEDEDDVLQNAERIEQMEDQMVESIAETANDELENRAIKILNKEEEQEEFHSRVRGVKFSKKKKKNPEASKEETKEADAEEGFFDVDENDIQKLEYVKRERDELKDPTAGYTFQGTDRFFMKTKELEKSVTKNDRDVAKSPREIRKRVQKMFGVGLVSKRYKGVKSKYILGVYDKARMSIFTKSSRSLGVLCHELGHHISADNNLMKLTGKETEELKELKKKFTKQVLEVMENAPMLKTKLALVGYNEENGEMAEEVVADFVWHYIVDPDTAFEMGSYVSEGNLYDTFEEIVPKEQLEKLNQVARYISAYNEMNPVERIRSTIHTRESFKKETETTLKDVLKRRDSDTFYEYADQWQGKIDGVLQGLIDANRPADIMMEQLRTVAGDRLSADMDLHYQLENMDSVTSAAAIIFENGMIDPFGRTYDSDCSLKKILKGLKHNTYKIDKKNWLNDFEVFLKAKHAITWEEMGRATISSDVIGDYGQNKRESAISMYIDTVNELNEKYKGYFEESANLLHEWWDTFMNLWAVETGLIEEDRMNKMREMYPDYIPMQRAIPSANTRSVTDKTNQVTKRASKDGSEEDTYSPIESLAMNAVAIMKAQRMNQVGKTIHRLRNHPNKQVQEVMNMYFIPVDPPQRKESVDVSGKKRRMERYLIKKTISEMTPEQKKEFDKLPEEKKEDYLRKISGFDGIDAILDDIVSSYSDDYGRLGDNAIIYRNNGELYAYEVTEGSTAVVNMLKALRSKSEEDAFSKAVARVTRFESALITGCNTFFAFRNGLRDLQHLYINGTDFGPLNAKLVYKYPAAMGKVFKNIVAGKKSGKFTEEFARFMLANDLGAKDLGIPSLDSVMRRVGIDQKGGIVRTGAKFANGFLDTVLLFNAVIEAAPRYAQYAATYNATKGSADAKHIAAQKKSREVTVNFHKAGSSKAAKSMRTYFMFANAALQGIKQTQEIVFSKKAWTTKEGRGKIVRALTGQMIPALLLQFLVADDEEYYQFSKRDRENYFLIPIGTTWVKIPKDRELSAIFATPVQMLLFAKHDDLTDSQESIAELSFNIFKNMYPDLSLPISSIIEARNNQTWYGDKLIAPEKERQLVAGHYQNIYDGTETSIAMSLAKFASYLPDGVQNFLNGGETTGALLTPKGIDYVLKQSGGFISQLLSPVVSGVEGSHGTGDAFSRSGQNFAYMLKKQFTAIPSTSSRYVSEAYDIYGMLSASKLDSTLNSRDRFWEKTVSNTMKKSSDKSHYITAGDYMAQIKEVRKNKNLTDKEREKQIIELYKKMGKVCEEMVRDYHKEGYPRSDNYGDIKFPDKAKDYGFDKVSYEKYVNAILTAGRKQNKDGGLQKGTSVDRQYYLVKQYLDGNLTKKQVKFLSEYVLNRKYSKYSEQMEEIAKAGISAEKYKAYFISSKEKSVDLPSTNSYLLSIDNALTQAFNKANEKSVGRTKQERLYKLVRDKGLTDEQKIVIVKSFATTKQKNDIVTDAESNKSETDRYTYANVLQEAKDTFQPLIDKKVTYKTLRKNLDDIEKAGKENEKAMIIYALQTQSEGEEVGGKNTVNHAYASIVMGSSTSYMTHREVFVNAANLGLNADMIIYASNRIPKRDKAHVSAAAESAGKKYGMTPAQILALKKVLAPNYKF